LKEKVSVTIDENLINWLDAQIKKKKFASRSHGFEYAINELMGKN
jgi:metal-responsive CopG/Arc/MetJ family transcriptional regulator